MPPTIVAGKWHWYNIVSDLDMQGGVKGVVIDPTTFLTAHGCVGKWGKIWFTLSWVGNKFLVVTMTRFSQRLVDAFSAVMGIRPFCRYNHSESTPCVTVEWSWDDAAERFEELKGDSAVSRLKKIK